MTDTWAAKVLEGVPVAYFNTRQADTPSGNLLPEEWMPAADVLAAIARMGAGDGLVERLNRADEYEPLGHDGWEAAAHIVALTALRDIARQKKTDEMDTEYDVEYADFEGGYNAIIDVAHVALRAVQPAPDPEPPKPDPKPHHDDDDDHDDDDRDDDGEHDDD